MYTFGAKQTDTNIVCSGVPRLPPLQNSEHSSLQWKVRWVLRCLLESGAFCTGLSSDYETLYLSFQHPLLVFQNTHNPHNYDLDTTTQEYWDGRDGLILPSGALSNVPPVDIASDEAASMHPDNVVSNAIEALRRTAHVKDDYP